LRLRSPSTASAIQKASEEPLDYALAVLEVEALAKADTELANTIQILVEVAEEDPSTKLTEIVQEIVNASKFQQPTTPITGKLAEKIGLVVQGGTVSIQNIDV
jgi:hypothetical protein